MKKLPKFLLGSFFMLSLNRFKEILKRDCRECNEFERKSRLFKKVMDVLNNQWDGDPQTLDISKVSFTELQAAMDVLLNHDDEDFMTVIQKDDPISHQLFMNVKHLFFDAIEPHGQVDYI